MNTESGSTPQAEPRPTEEQEPQFKTIREIDPFKLQEFQERIQHEQNLTLGIIAGAAAALLGAILWGAITYFTQYQISWMAIGVAFMVGWSLRQFGKGVDKIFGVFGAVLALGSCLLGNFLTFAAIIARELSASFFDVLLFMLSDPAADLEIFIAAFSPIDLLFYGVAIYYGYQYSFRRITAEEQEGLYRTRTVVA
jgi:hypothetical protein